MRPSAALESTGIHRCLRDLTVGFVVATAGAVLVAAAVAAQSPAARACPSAAVVTKALGMKAGAPVATTTEYSKTCTYPGGGVGSTKITFQADTAASFAAGENAAGRFGSKIIKVHGLGQAAWTTGLGDIYVFDGQETIKVLALSLEVRSPTTATAKVEALARQLLQS